MILTAKVPEGEGVEEGGAASRGERRAARLVVELACCCHSIPALHCQLPLHGAAAQTKHLFDETSILICIVSEQAARSFDLFRRR